MMDLQDSNLDLSLLNCAQQGAVKDTEGPCLIIAGPGSGKTRVLTYRIAYLVLAVGVPPYQICALTFTKKAAIEMKKRLEELMGEQAKKIWIGTFHSVFARILRQEADALGFTPDFSIYDSDDSKSLLKKIIKELGLDEKRYPPSYLIKRIGEAKRHFMLAADYLDNLTWQEEDRAIRMPHLYMIYRHYEARCRGANAMDYDDLLLHTHLLFKAHPEVRSRYQEQFDYLLIDEFQDTDPIQYAILRQLAVKTNNIAIIGDDAQSIYAFRGADRRNIDNFKRDYPETKIFKLEQNYRSTQKIVAAANALIKHNPHHPKTLFTENEAGAPILLLPMFNPIEEAIFIADAITKRLQNPGTTYDDFAIIYRSNFQSRILEETLMRRNIPYQLIGSLSFYQRQEIKDFLAYLHLVVNPNHEEALRRAINVPKRNIGPITLQKIYTYAREQAITPWEAIQQSKHWLTGQVGDRVAAFAALIDGCRARLAIDDAYTIAKDIAHRAGLIKLWESDTSLQGANRYENVKALLEAISQFKVDGEQASLTTFLEEVTLFTAMEEEERSSHRVKLMTAHKAKGLEFTYVYMIGLEEGIFPSSPALQSRQAIEEERRLFFVALTRAKKELTLTCTENRYHYGENTSPIPSRFLKELNLPEESLPGLWKKETQPPTTGQLPRKLVKATSTSSAPMPRLRIGMTIAHPIFGKGEITAIDEQRGRTRLIVNFFRQGQKTLMLPFAKIKVCSPAS